MCIMRNITKICIRLLIWLLDTICSMHRLTIKQLSSIIIPAVFYPHLSTLVNINILSTIFKVYFWVLKLSYGSLTDVLMQIFSPLLKLRSRVSLRLEDPRLQIRNSSSLSPASRNTDVTVLPPSFLMDEGSRHALEIWKPSSATWAYLDDIII